MLYSIPCTRQKTLLSVIQVLLLERVELPLRDSQETGKNLIQIAQTLQLIFCSMRGCRTDNCILWLAHAPDTDSIFDYFRKTLCNLSKRVTMKLAALTTPCSSTKQDSVLISARHSANILPIK